MAKVLDILEKAGLTLRRDKCKFLLKEVDYLRYTISEKGVQPKEDLLKAIKLAATPTTKDQLKPFMGLIEYYSTFVLGFAHKTEALRELLRKGVPFNWSSAQKKAFQKIKDDIVNACIITPL